MKRRDFLKTFLLLYPASIVCATIKNIGLHLDKFYYSVFFDYTQNNMLLFSYSIDGENWSIPVTLNYKGRPLNGRDPSLVYYRGKWLLLLTGGKEDQYDASFFVSDDLNSWQLLRVVLGGNETITSSYRLWDNSDVPSRYVWAPELIKDSRDILYIVASVQIGIDSNKKNTMKFFGLYLSRCDDTNKFIFSKAKRIKLIEYDGAINKYSRIDPFIIYDEPQSRYILATKRENFGVIDFFESSVISGDYKYIGCLDLHSLNSSMDIEGPSICWQRNKWYVYFDSYYLRKGIMYVTTSDFKLFSKPKGCNIDRAEFMRHGTISKTY
ncbi:TPA: hypothetical protein PCJ76_004841 [Klebsiella quasipneumoniae]|nr:hypothetical protein [Klebsiella quasipneumoniae]